MSGDRQFELVPVSQEQEGLWLQAALEDQGEPSALNVVVLIRIRGRVREDLLLKSFETLISRHEAWRCGFAELDGAVVARLYASIPPPPVKAIDLVGVPEPQQQTTIRDICHEEARRRFDLASPPLLRLTLLRLGEELSGLLVVAHHLITDAVSEGIYVGELGRTYEDLAAGRSPSLPELSLQYPDYSHWQSSHAYQHAQADGIAYWQSALQNVKPLELPADFPRRPVRSLRGARYHFDWDPSVIERVRDAARREGVTPFVYLLSAFTVMLSRYTGQTDIVVGTPMANRERPELLNVVGFFVNVVALRIDLSGGPSFRELLARVRQTVRSAQAHQCVPFGAVVRALGVDRDLSRTPVSQVNFQIDMQTESADADGVAFTLHGMDAGTAISDLRLVLKPRRAYVEYATDLFAEVTIQRMVDHFARLLESCVEGPHQRVSKLSMLSEAEHHQRLVEWNDSEAELPDVCAHELISRRAEARPYSVALAFGDEHLSYGELERRSTQLGRYLQRLGVGPATLVGISMQRCPEQFIGLIGILNAGGAYVPLDPAYPEERLRQMEEDCALSLVLTQRDTADRPWAAQRVELDGDWGEVSAEPAMRAAPKASLEDLAYVIFTSGSTGRPKGVAAGHHGLANLAMRQREFFRIVEQSRVLQFASFSFDASVSEWAVSLCSGAALCLVSEETLVGDELRAWVDQNAITHGTFPPSVLASTWRATPPGAMTIISAGEALPRAVAVQVGAGGALINAYGPTECTVCGSMWRVRVGEPVQIGRAMGNARLYLRQGGATSAPLAELWIEGSGVARGYLNAAAASADRFQPSPAGDSPGTRSYGTGDIVRYRRDGSAEYVGRADHQVKVRGYRVELGEIESALERLKPRIQRSGDLFVRQSVVIAHAATGGDRVDGIRLVAYVVLEPAVGEARLDPQEQRMVAQQLRSELERKLPSYMVPSSFVVLEQLPLTPSGKVDRGALADPGRDRSLARTAYVEPRTEVERTLAAIWQDVLGIERVGAEDNFFEVGGDSILAVRVAALCAEAGIRVTVRRLFSHKTISRLAGVVEVDHHTAIYGAEQAPVSGAVTLTPIQRWFLDQSLRQSHHFNQSAMFVVRGLQRGDRRGGLKKLFSAIVARHDMLRARYVEEGGSWRQVLGKYDVGDELERALSFVDGQEWGDEWPRELARAANEAQASLDLADGPLFRAIHFDLGAALGDRLFVVIHHLVVDAVSWRILERDLRRGLSQLSRGERVALGAKGTSFSAWAERLRELANDPSLAEEVSYWEGRLSAAVPRLPVDDATGANRVEDGGERRIQLSEEQTSLLSGRVPQTYYGDINDVLLTALARALCSWQGTRCRLCVGLEGHGREELFSDVDVSRTMGWFTSLFPVVLDLGDPEEEKVDVARPALAAPVGGDRYVAAAVAERGGDPQLGQLSLGT